MKLVVFWLLGVPLAVALMLGGFSMHGQTASASSAYSQAEAAR